MDMLAVRSEIFGNNPPASTAVVVAGLAFPGLLIEVEAIAVKQSRVPRDRSNHSETSPTCFGLV